MLCPRKSDLYPRTYYEGKVLHVYADGAAIPGHADNGRARFVATASQTDKVGDETSWCCFLIQGAQIPPEAYIPLAKRIQSESSLSIYVVIPAFALNTPEPLVLSGGIEKGIQSMHDAGLDKEADIVLMGHSLGGAMLQDYVFKCKFCKSQILDGGRTTA